MPGRRKPERALAPDADLLLVADQALCHGHAATGGGRNPRQVEAGRAAPRLAGGSECPPDIAHGRSNPRQQRPGFDRDAVARRGRCERRDLDRGFFVAGLPVEASRERERGPASELAVVDEIRRRARTSQRGFGFAETLLVGPDNPDADDRPEPARPVVARAFTGACRQRSRPLELGQRGLALAPIAKNPGQLFGAGRRQRVLAARFEDARRARQQSNGRGVPAARRQPGAAIGRVAQHAAHATRRQSGGWRAKDVRRRRLVHDGEPSSRLPTPGGAQAFEEEARPAGRSARGVEQVLVRRAVIAIDEHH